MSTYPQPAPSANAATGAAPACATDACSSVTFEPLIVRPYKAGRSTKMMDWHATKAPWSLISRRAPSNYVAFTFEDNASGARTKITLWRRGALIDNIRVTGFRYRVSHKHHTVTVSKSRGGPLVFEFQHM